MKAVGPNTMTKVFKRNKNLVRGTQRLFSVKYLFGEANFTQNFLLLERDG